jgi:plasmid stabilization system protein ParE
VNFIVQPPAYADWAAALAWFVARQQYRQVGDLDSAIETALDRIEVREFYIPRYRYRVIYYIAGNDIRVIAITHSRQHDRHWQSRLTP